MRFVSAVDAAKLLREGKVGLVPTETVVGLVAGEAGLDRLFEIKGRDPGKPIALLYPTAKEAFALAREVSPLALSLADLFWPGPLTLVLDSEDATAGVRVPSHPVAQAVLAAYGGPLYATSANPSGKPAPRALDEMDPLVSETVDFAVEGEPGGGEASAVVDLSGRRMRLLRPTGNLSEGKLSQMAEDIGESVKDWGRK